MIKHVRIRGLGRNLRELQVDDFAPRFNVTSADGLIARRQGGFATVSPVLRKRKVCFPLSLAGHRMTSEVYLGNCMPGYGSVRTLLPRSVDCPPAVLVRAPVSWHGARTHQHQPLGESHQQKQSGLPCFQVFVSFSVCLFLCILRALKQERDSGKKTWRTIARLSLGSGIRPCQVSRGISKHALLIPWQFSQMTET